MLSIIVLFVLALLLFFLEIFVPGGVLAIFGVILHPILGRHPSGIAVFFIVAVWLLGWFVVWRIVIEYNSGTRNPIDLVTNGTKEGLLFLRGWLMYIGIMLVIGLVLVVLNYALTR